MVHQYFETRKKHEKDGQAASMISEYADLNFFIYIVIRDSKLLELREKIEHSPPIPGSNLQGRQVPFLFQIC